MRCFFVGDVLDFGFVAAGWRLSTAVDFMIFGSDSITVFLNNYMPVYDVYMAAIVLSLLYAAYKVFYKKEDLLMTCDPLMR